MRHIIMSGWTPIFIACGPLPHSGKTTSARLLVDFCRATGRPPLVFDANPHAPALAALAGEGAETVNLATTAGQMRLFEGLVRSGPQARIVDLWHGAYEPFLDLLEQTEFAAEAEARDLKLVLLLHGRDMHDLANCYGPLHTRTGGAEAIAVINEYICDDPGEARTLPFERTLSIPAMAPSILRRLERMRLDLVAGIDPDRGLPSLVARNCLRDWLTRIFAQFHGMELRHRLGATVFNPL